MGILSDIRVLDFSRVLAGPYATRILADFGAEVIKVQSKKTATGSDSNTGNYFSTWNRNKRSITLDLSYLEARELLLKIIALCDVVVENFSPRVMMNWELTYKHLKQVKPDLVMLSMSGMGQTGPLKNNRAFGPTVQALGGLAYLTAYEKNSPIDCGYAHADTLSGLYGAFSVLAALNHRDQTGEGEYIDLSEYETVCALVGPELMQSFTNPEEDAFRSPNEPGNTNAAPYGCYPCKGTDRWCVIAVHSEDQWQALCTAMGRPEWALHNMFSTPAKRKRHSQALDGLMAEWTSRLDPATVVACLQGSGVPAGVVQNAADLFHDPHLLARSFFSTLDHPALGSIVSDGPVIRLGEDSTSEWKAAPLLGEANRYIFRDLLGLAESDFLHYVECGIIG